MVDYHAITTPFDPKEMEKNILETAAVYLAAGINPEKSTVFIQSHNSDHTELAWILGTITRMSDLFRMTQFKEKLPRYNILKKKLKGEVIEKMLPQKSQKAML